MKARTKLLLLAALVLSTACSTPARLGLLRDLEYNVPSMARPAPELRLKVGDRVSIQVFSVDEELAAPFNASTGGSVGEGASKLASTYGVDARGEIDFPVLGKIPVEGKTMNEVQKQIAADIIRCGYIKEPVVKVDLENFKITVLGETGQDVLPVEGTSINILEVIARSGGMNEYSKIPEVVVVRTENGERTAYAINLQTKDLYDSPVFWLQQDDLVYVQPQGVRLSSGGDLFLKIMSPTIAAVSAVAYMLLWTSR